MYNVNDVVFEGYGTDRCGRTGVFRTKNKDEIVTYIKNCDEKNFILTLKVISIEPVSKLRQLDFFNLIF